MENKNTTFFNNIAVLVDGDNDLSTYMNLVINKTLTFGRIALKRVYGNWKKTDLKNWEAVIKELAFNAQQQFDYVKKKNATDIALVIDAMKLLFEKRYDAFVIVSNDSDFTPLSIALKETGVYVIGFGTENASDAFIRSCDDFYDVCKLSTSALLEASENETGLSGCVSDPRSTEEKELHGWLKFGAETERWQDEEGFVNVASIGQYIKRIRPDFDITLFGYKKLPDFIEAHKDIYVTKTYQGKGKSKIRAYKCKL